MADNLSDYDKFKSRATAAQVKLLSEMMSGGSMSSEDKEKVDYVYTEISKKQDKLVSGVNLATINGQSLLNGGNISVTSTSSGQAVSVINSLNNTSTEDALSAKMGKDLNDALTSHTGNTTIHVATGERSSWNLAVSKSHTHANSTVLTGITSAEVSSWDNAATKSHTHSNMTELEGIDADRMEMWDLKQDKLYSGENIATINGQSLLNGGNILVGGSSIGGTTAVEVIDNLSSSDTDKALSANQGRLLNESIGSHALSKVVHITSQERSKWDEAYSNEHVHSNLSALESISSVDIYGWTRSSHTHNNKTSLDRISAAAADSLVRESESNCVVIKDASGISIGDDGKYCYTVNGERYIVCKYDDMGDDVYIDLPDDSAVGTKVAVINIGQETYLVRSSGLIVKRGGANNVVDIDYDLVTFTRISTNINGVECKWICDA